MSDKPRKFPLALSVVVDQSIARNARARKVARPQTATQNAARNQTQASDTAQTYSFSKQGPRTSPLISDGVRQAMVDRLAQQGICYPEVLRAMAVVPRHLFIDSALASQAYIDTALPIGHHQTISQPYIVARMIEIMCNGRRPQRVLEIGTGCGYQAVVLAQLTQEVFSIERIKALYELAKSNLRPLRIANLRLHYGDGMLGLPQVAPFDGIILAAAGMEVPHALLEQLRVGGRLVAPVGQDQQVLQLIERVAASEWRYTTLEACRFVPLRAGIM